MNELIFSDRRQRKGTKQDADAMFNLLRDIGFVVDNIYQDYDDVAAIEVKLDLYLLVTSLTQKF